MAMYEIVGTNNENLFKKIFDELNVFWGRRSAILEGNAKKFLILNKKEAVGIMEINEFTIGGYSNVTLYCPRFYEYLTQKQGISNTYEIGKLFVREEERVKGHVKSLISIIFEHHKETGALFYTSMIADPLNVFPKNSYRNNICHTKKKYETKRAMASIASLF